MCECVIQLQLCSSLIFSTDNTFIHRTYTDALRQSYLEALLESFSFVSGAKSFIIFLISFQSLLRLRRIIVDERLSCVYIYNCNALSAYIFQRDRKECFLVFTAYTRKSAENMQFERSETKKKLCATSLWDNFPGRMLSILSIKNLSQKINYE